jgi:hypothetical protein
MDNDISVGLSFLSMRFHASQPLRYRRGNPLQLLLKLRTTLKKRFQPALAGP